MNERDEAKVVELLREEFGLGFDTPLPETGRVPTFRCADGLRRAGILYIQQRIDLKAFKARIRQARRWDEKHFARVDAMVITPVVVVTPEDREEFERMFEPSP